MGIIIFPKEINSSPKAQSLHLHEYGVKTGNSCERVIQQKNPHDFLQITPENNTPLNLHDIPEQPFQIPTRMGIFHPRNWFKQENQSSTSSHNSQMIKSFFSCLIPVFYKNYYYSKFPNPSINQIQVELVWLLMLCHVASLFTFPLLSNLSRSLLAFSNSKIRPLRCSVQS